MYSLFRVFLSRQGRLRRRAYWGYAIVLTIVFTGAFLIIERVAGRGLTLILYPPFLWSAFALMSRRLHDSARSAWWLAAVIIPVIGPLWVAILLCLVRGARGDNQYGPDPRDAHADYLAVKIDA